jgi:hypothetical protein
MIINIDAPNIVAKVQGRRTLSGKANTPYYPYFRMFVQFFLHSSFEQYQVYQFKL